jgi:polyadenylate-binding protein
MQMMSGPWGMMPMKPTTFAPPLYVGDLDDNIHEEFLYDIFSKYGPLHFVRIMRDSGTGKSRGYAFVNFVNPRDAETAKQHAQYEKLGKKHIRIMFKRNVREMPSDANIFVKNIDPNVTVKDLHEHFKQATTNIISAKVNTDHDGKNLGYGYVQFEKGEDALEAIKALNGSKLKEKELDLSIFLPRDKRGTSNVKRNIYVRGLPAGTSEAELDKIVTDLFSKYGTIESKMLSKHKTSGLYTAFVCYKEQESAQKAFTDLETNKVTLPGATEPLYVNWHQAKVERQKELNKQYSSGVSETNLFLKNLKLETTVEQLKSVFGQFGTVNSCAVKEWTSKTGKKKANCGFVAFDNATDATNAMSESPNNTDAKALFLPGENIYIQRHQSKDKRHAFLVSERRKRQMQFNQNFGMNMYPPAGFMPQNFRRTQPYPMGGMPTGQGPKGPRQGPPGGVPYNQKPQPHRGGPRHQQGGMPMQHQQQQQLSRDPQQLSRGGPTGTRPPMGQPQQSNQLKPKPQETKPQASQVVTAAQLKMRLAELQTLDHDKQRQILGEMLFPKIQAITPELAPKITGMLIDLEVPEVIELLEDNNMLQERIQEAKELLEGTA